MTEPYRITQDMLEAYARIDANGNYVEPCTDLEDAYSLAVEVRDSRIHISALEGVIKDAWEAVQEHPPSELSAALSEILPHD